LLSGLDDPVEAARAIATLGPPRFWDIVRSSRAAGGEL
jgi:hypothetical protein